MRTALYKKWLYERQFILPDEEEKQLKLIVARSKNNQLVKAIKDRSLQPITAEEEDDIDGNYGPPPPLPKDNTTTAATVGVKALLAHRNFYFNENGTGSRKRLSLSFLPVFLRERVFDFLPVIDPVFLNDLATMESMLLISDCEGLRDADLAEEVTSRVQAEVLGIHSKEFGDFALVAQSMGIVGVPVLQLQQPAQMKYGADLGRTLRLARSLAARQTKFRQWTEFRLSTLDTTCLVLRLTIRSDFALWRKLLTEWRSETPFDDVIVVTALEELAALESRVGGIEFLGSEELELDDVRNMFFELDLPMPDPELVTADYTKSLTLAQVITLGMIDIPWVKGYSWEDRARILELEELEEEEVNAVRQSSVRSGGGGEDSRSATSSSRASSVYESAEMTSRRQALLKATTTRQQRSIDQAAREAREKKEKAEEEAVLLALEQKRTKQRAASVAADSMTQRIWISTEQYKQRWQHRFGGCEYCASLPIHHVGLKLKGSAVTTDIALCHSCFNDLYADEKSVAHRMYQWYVVSDLVGGLAPVAVVAVDEVPQLSEMGQQLKAIKQREEAEEAETALILAQEAADAERILHVEAEIEKKRKDDLRKQKLLETAPQANADLD